MAEKDEDRTPEEDKDSGKLTKSSAARTTVYGSVDGGWAWVIIVALVFWNALVAGTLKSFGIIYLEYLDLYQRGPVATAWMGFSFSIIITVIAPLSGYLGDYTSLRHQRILVMCLGVVMATAITITGWMPNLESAIATYGTAGLAVSLVDTPVLSLLGKYFKRRRYLASGLVFAGSSFGTLVLPPIFTLLVDAYAVRGAMTVFGGIWLNVMVVGAVVRPVKTNHAPTVDVDVGDEVQKRSADGNEQLDRAYLTSQRTLSLEPQPFGVNMFIANSRQSLDPVLTQRALQRQDHSKSAPCLQKLLHRDNGTLSLSDVSADVDKDFTQPKAAKESFEGADGQAVEGPTERSSRLEGYKLRSLSFVKKLCDIVLDYWRFVQSPGLPMLMFTFCAASFAYFNQFFIFPPLARELGMTKIQGAMLLSVSNVTELMSRLVVGLLVDAGKVRKPHLVEASFAMSAILAMAVSFSASHTLLFVYSAVFGLMGGVFVPLAIPLMVDLVHVSQISSATGIYVLVTGAGISLGPPLLGGVKALTGTFTDSLRICSIFYVTALVSYVIHQRGLTACSRSRKKAVRPPDAVSVVEV